LLEGLDHQLRRLVTDRARGDLEAVADGVVLVGLDGKRILALQRLQPALRHREGIVGEVDLLLVLGPLVEGEVDDPAAFEAVAVDEVQLLAGAGARLAREPVELRRVAGDEEAGVAVVETELRADRLGALLADVLGERAGALELLALLAPEDIAE